MNDGSSIQLALNNIKDLPNARGNENLLPTEEMVINFTQDQVKNWPASVMTKKKSLVKKRTGRLRKNDYNRRGNLFFRP